MIALSAEDILLIYLIPLVVVFGAWLTVALTVYIGVKSRIDFDFKHDILRKFYEKRDLPSGRDQLSFLYVVKILLGDSCIQATFLYRISSFLARHRLRTPAELVHAFSRFLTHADLSPWANIAPGLYLYHGLGTVIGKGANIGNRALICQGVTIGGGATLGDDVKVWAGAQVLAKVTVGDRAEVGANAVVTTDFPADSILVGVPARLAGNEASEPAASWSAS
jgi:serine O-acetyltransferase